MIEIFKKQHGKFLFLLEYNKYPGLYRKYDLLLSIIFQTKTQWFGNMVYAINLKIKNIFIYTPSKDSDFV